MHGSQGRLFIMAYRRIITHKSAHFGRGGDEMNGDAPAHAVAANSHSAFVHMRLLSKKRHPSVRTRDDSGSGVLAWICDPVTIWVGSGKPSCSKTLIAKVL